MQTICSLSIRISELEYITVEAIYNGEAKVNCKGKIRKVFIVKDLQRHNLRHLFARTFYEIEKDIAKLADILGHNESKKSIMYYKYVGVTALDSIDKRAYKTAQTWWSKY